MSYKRLGDYIQLVDNRNIDSLNKNLRGLSMHKVFRKHTSNISGSDMSKYKIVKRNQFACDFMSVIRVEALPIVIQKEEDEIIVSPAYYVFEIIDFKKLLPDFLMMWFLRSEFDRYAFFKCDSAVRGGFGWEELCELKIPIPDIDEQRKYVALYKGLLANQKTYENSLDDLQLICDTYIEDLIKKEPLKKLGEYIQQSDERNRENKFTSVKGMSVLKEFRSPSRKVNMKNLSNYRVVRYNEFGYVQTTNNEKVLIVCLSKFEEPIIISSIHIVFRVKDEKQLLPEYLYLFFKRKDIDRYARFHSWGSARETFDWDNMCNVKLPIPSIEKQEAIVTIYHTLETRKRINEQLKESIKPLCPVLMKGVVENMKFETLES